MQVEERLISLVKNFYNSVDHCIGYPVCQYPNISGFGEWYVKTGLIDYDQQGRMDPDSFRKNFDPSRPALIVFGICLTATPYFSSVRRIGYA